MPGKPQHREDPAERMWIYSRRPVPRVSVDFAIASDSPRFNSGTSISQLCSTSPKMELAPLAIIALLGLFLAIPSFLVILWKLTRMRTLSKNQHPNVQPPSSPAVASMTCHELSAGSVATHPSIIVLWKSMPGSPAPVIKAQHQNELSASPAATPITCHELPSEAVTTPRDAVLAMEEGRYHSRLDEAY